MLFQNSTTQSGRKLPLVIISALACLCTFKSQGGANSHADKVTGTANTLEHYDDLDAAKRLAARCPELPYRERNGCIGKALNMLDEQMNILYDYLVKEVDDPTNIQKAQKAWSAFRDVECPSVDPNSTAEPQAFYAEEYICKIALTRTRIRQLNEQISTACPDYVSGTPCPGPESSK